MGKRVLCGLLVVVLSISFCVVSLSCNYVPYAVPIRVSASSIIDSGVNAGVSSRAEPADDQDSSDFYDMVRSCLGVVNLATDGNGQYPIATSTLAKDILSWCCGAAGAIFTDQTFDNLNAGFKALYVDYGDNVTPELLHQIFYLGKDGNLYFTDEWLNNFNTLLSEQEYNNGYVYFYPNSASSQIYQYAIDNVSYPGLLSMLSNAISGNGNPLFVSVASKGIDIYSASLDYYGSFGDLSYNQYLSSYANNTGTGSITIHCVSGSFINSRYTSDGFSDNVSGTELSGLALYSPSANFISVSGNTVSSRVYLLSSNPIPAYRSQAWFEYYQSGGTGVLLTDVAGDIDGIVNTLDNNYDALQAAYVSMAEDIANGSKSLDDVRKAVSEMNETVQDIVDDTGEIVETTGSILSYLRKIYYLLLADTALDAVNTASNLIGLIGDYFDGLFDAGEGALNIFDIVADGLGDTILTVFPFSLPRDYQYILDLISADPQVPKIEYHLKISNLGIDYKFRYVADDFEKLAYVSRFFSSVVFVVFLINLTDKMLRD